MQVAPDTTFTCPRCGASVNVEFRFCPECAFRVQGGTLPRAAPPRAPTLPYILVALGAIALIGGFVLAGFALFRTPGPREIATTPPRDDGTPADPIASPLTRLTESFVHVEAAFASFDKKRDIRGALIYEIEELPDGTKREVLRDLPVFVEEMKMMRYEVSGDQYATFLEAVATIDDPAALIDLELDYRDIFATPESLIAVLEATRSESTPSTFDGPVASAWDWMRDGRAVMQRLSFAEGYLQKWWDTVRKHLGSQAPDKRPDWLHLPVDIKYAPLVLAPPHWINRRGAGPLSWALPVGSGNRRAAVLPVTNVSLLEARAFSTWASRELGRTLYVPTEAQFTRAFSGPLPDDDDPDGEQRQWPWGERTASWLFNSRAYWEDEVPRLLPVTHVYGTAVEPARTPEKIQDLAGNAREWTQPQIVHIPDSLAPGQPGYLIVTAIRSGSAATMGGSYLMGLDECTTEYFNTADIRSRDIDLGFRLVGNVPLTPGAPGGR